MNFPFIKKRKHFCIPFLISGSIFNMKYLALLFCFTAVSVLASAQLTSDKSLPSVKTANGLLQGTQVSGISMFKGVAYAQPPVGELRWKEPQPLKNWEGTRRADHFAPRAMQLPIYSDMQFRSDGISEDCLYLNIWSPAKKQNEELPVLVYFYGGGFRAGDGSEYRYDGENMARRGIVSITVNYRLGVFGFLAHPDLTNESAHHASGNYGLMDQTEALRWIHKNIAAFGGNPENITIAGESAGSTSVCAQVISPLPRNLFAAAIGESGSVLGYRPTASLQEAEKHGVQFAENTGARSIHDLRAMSAQQILQATEKPGTDFPIDVDGYFFPENPLTLYKAGKIARVPLLIGWNTGEGNWKGILGNREPTVDNYIQSVKKIYGRDADQILKIYTVHSDADVQSVASALSNDRSVYSTWKWADQHAKTNSQVYRYIFGQPRPGLRSAINQVPASAEINSTSSKKPEEIGGAVHSAEIEYALGNLPTNRVYDWQPDDFMVSIIMQNYFLNFIKTKNPNGPGLPYWPLYQSWQSDPVQYIGTDTHREADIERPGFLLLEKSGSEDD